MSCDGRLIMLLYLSVLVSFVSPIVTPSYRLIGKASFLVIPLQFYRWFHITNGRYCDYQNSNYWGLSFEMGFLKLLIGFLRCSPL